MSPEREAFPMFSEVDIRDDFRSNDKNRSHYGGYRPTRFLVMVFTFLVLCSFLLAGYFWINPKAFPAIYSRSSRPSSVPNGPPRQLSPQEIQLANERYVIAMMLAGIGIAYLIVYLKLMSRFYHNAAMFKGSRLEISRGLFLLSWFIPFANLYFPFRTTQSILNHSRPRTLHQTSSSDKLLMAFWVTMFVAHILAIVVIAIAVDSREVLITGEIPLTIRAIDSANSIASVVLLCLLIYRIDHYQSVQSRRPTGEAQTTCLYCGEQVPVSAGNCPMCGRKIAIGTAAPR